MIKNCNDPLKKSCANITTREDGNCDYCTQLLISASKKPKPKYSSIKKKYCKVKKRDEGQKKELKSYYHYQLIKASEKPFSEATGTKIYAPSILNIAHILPKSVFQDIAAELSNCIILTTGEHERFDKLFFEARFSDIANEMPEVDKLLRERIPALLKMTKKRNKFYFKILRYYE